MRRSRVLALPAALVVAALGAGASRAATSDISANWAGYVAGSSSSRSVSFSSVSGTWVQPAARCSSTASTGATAAAFWVGLGGNSSYSDALEQIGTESDCAAGGTARYSAWYELVPATSVRVKLTVKPGDTIAASVSVEGTKVTLGMKNVTRGTSFSKTLRMAAPDVSSADWIAEAPSLCSAGDVCRQAALTNFDTVEFTQASATAGGHTGGISDPSWTTTAVRLVASAGRRGYGRFAPQLSVAQAVPSALTAKGGGFSITWSRGEVVQRVPGYGYGYGPGFGFYG
jgi:Peptidase A4 family